MKKIFLSLLLVLTLCSCKMVDTNYNIEKVSTVIDYDSSNKATIKLSNDIDVNTLDIVSKNNHINQVKKLIGGDEIELYYDKTNNLIKHAYVIEAKEIRIKLSSSVVPGSNGKTDIFPYDSNSDIRLNVSQILYIINEDDTFTNINDFVSTDIELYGTYSEKNKTDYTTPYNYTVIKLSAIYSYCPR